MSDAFDQLAIPDLSHVSEIHAGAYFTCAAHLNQITCWGDPWLPRHPFATTGMPDHWSAGYYAICGAYRPAASSDGLRLVCEGDLQPK